VCSRCPALNEGKSTLDDMQTFFNIADSPQKYTEQWVKGAWAVTHVNKDITHTCIYTQIRAYWQNLPCCV
jgi:hypothetical protein